MSAESTYKVLDVHRVEDWDGQHGPMRSFYVGLEGEGEVQLRQKPETPAPRAGESLFGHVESGPRGKVFRKARQFSSNGGGGKDYKADPAKLRGEAMRSAIHAASSYTASMAELGRLPEGFTYRQMDPMIDHWYQRIVKAMGE